MLRLAARPPYAAIVLLVLCVAFFVGAVSSVAVSTPAAPIGTFTFQPQDVNCRPISDVSITRVVPDSLDNLDVMVNYTVGSDADCINGSGSVPTLHLTLPGSQVVEKITENSLSCRLIATESNHLDCSTVASSPSGPYVKVGLTLASLLPGAQAITVHLTTAATVPTPFELTVDMFGADSETLLASGQLRRVVVPATEPGINYADESAIIEKQITRGEHNLFSIVFSFGQSQFIKTRTLSVSFPGIEFDAECSAFIWGKTSSGAHKLFYYFLEFDRRTTRFTIPATPYNADDGDTDFTLSADAFITCGLSPPEGDTIKPLFHVAPSATVSVGSLVIPPVHPYALSNELIRAEFQLFPSSNVSPKRLALLNKRIASGFRTFFTSKIVPDEKNDFYYFFDATTNRAVLRIQNRISLHLRLTVLTALSTSFLENILAKHLIVEPYLAHSPVGATIGIERVSVVTSTRADVTHKCESDPSGSPSQNRCMLKPCSREYVVEPVCYFGVAQLSVPRRECAFLGDLPVDTFDSGCESDIDSVGISMQTVDDTTLDMLVRLESSTGRIDHYPLTLKVSDFSKTLPPGMEESVVSEVFVVDENGSETEDGVGALEKGLEEYDPTIFSFKMTNDRTALRRIRFSNTDPALLSSFFYLSSISVGMGTEPALYSSPQDNDCMATDTALSLYIPVGSISSAISGVAIRFGSDFTHEGCTTLLVPGGNSTATALFPSEWEPLVTSGSYPAADGRDFHFIPRAFSGAASAEVLVRCAGSFPKPYVSSHSQIITAALVGEDGLLYQKLIVNAMLLPMVYGPISKTHTYYFPIHPTSVTIASLTPLLESLVPEWLANDDFTIRAVSSDDTDPDSFVTTILFKFSLEAIAFQPRYLTTFESVFRRTLNVDLAIPPSSLPLTEAHTMNNIGAFPIGQWVCAPSGTADEDWATAAPCAVPNNCGNEPEGERRCAASSYMLPSGSAVYEYNTAVAQATCAFAEKPWPTFEGCGTMMCRDPTSPGDFVACDSPKVCVEGCRAGVEISEEIITTDPAFAAECVLNGTIVDGGLCPSPVEYAATCNATSDCGTVCTDASGNRVDCAGDEAWGPCSASCGDGIQNLRYVCGDTNVPMSNTVAEVNDELCDWDDGVGLNTTRSCIGTVCPTHVFLCRADDLDEWGSCDDDTSFGSCSVPCGAGVRTRKVGCALILPDGDIIGTPEGSGHADCADITPIPSATTQCDAGACPPNRWECLAAGSTTPEPCDDVPFPACPTDGCFEPEPVSRTVGCYSGLTGELLDNDACSDAGLSPNTTEECPLVTVNCTVDFPVESPCHDASGTEHTCLVPGTDPAIVTRAGVCIDSYDTGAVVPDAWCPALPMDAVCDDLPACPAHAARWVETVAAECYAGADATCRSYRPVTAVCEVQFSDGGEWQAGDASDCASLPAPKTEVPCEDMPSCGAHGECISTSSSDNTGVCKCSDNYTGSFCEEEPSEEPLLVTLKAAAEPGTYTIEWSVPSVVPAGAAAQVSLVLHTDPASSEELVVPVVTTDASDRTVTFTAMGLVKAGDYFARVIIADKYSGESAPLTIAPGCLADGSASCLNGGSCAPETGECECSLGYTGPVCEEEPTEIVVTLTAEADEPGSYTIEWAVPSFIPANATALVSLVLHADPAQGGGLTVPVTTTEASSRFVTFVALDLVQEGVYFARVIVADEYSGESSPVAIAPGCLAGDSASCLNGGTCTPKTGACVCTGEWTGPSCSISPCHSSRCNPNGGTCSVSPAGDAVCTCATGVDGAPLFTGPNCLTPVDGCTATLPTCAHGGVRTGALTDPSSGQVTCGECACENQWTPVSDCADCGLVCINGGTVDGDCSKCTCRAAGGYHGNACACRHVRMSFVILASALPFAAPGAVDQSERTRLLAILGTSFAADLAYLTKASSAIVEAVTERTSSKGVPFVRLSFLLGHVCPPTASASVTDTDMLPVYHGIVDLKSLLDDVFVALAAADRAEIAPALMLLHPAAGFSAHDPNCRLGKGGCPSGWRGNGVLPGETDGTGGDDGGDGETGTESKSSGLSTGAIVGIAIGGAVAFLILLLLILWFAGVIGSSPKRSQEAPATEMTSV